MKQTELKRISDKRKELLRQEAKKVKELMAECQGHCMICGKFAPLEKNHSRDRKRFIMSCRECHFPNGRHRYLDDVPERKD